VGSSGYDVCYGALFKDELMRGLSKGTLLSAEVNGNSWTGVGRGQFRVTIVKSDGLCKRSSSITIRTRLNPSHMNYHSVECEK
jgi:hypothetical protein